MNLQNRAYPARLGVMFFGTLLSQEILMILESRRQKYYRSMIAKLPGDREHFMGDNL